MVSYVLRRLLYSVPIVLIASFVLFVAVRATFDPLAKLRQSRDPEVHRPRERAARARPLGARAVRALGSRASSTGSGGRAPAPASRSAR